MERTAKSIVCSINVRSYIHPNTRIIILSGATKHLENLVLILESQKFGQCGGKTTKIIKCSAGNWE